VVPGFEGWQQVLAVAKEKAAAEKKDLLIVFGSSDGNPDTVRLATALKDAGLPGGELGKKFVPLVIDFPETDTGMNRVLDRRQNRKLKGEYAIADELPVLALADDQGHPYAIQREWPEGVSAAERTIEDLASRRKERDDLLAATSAGDEQQQLDAAVGFVKWISSQKLLLQYRDAIHPWWSLAVKEDPTNAAGKQEVILEAEMMCKLTDLPDDAGTVAIVQRLDLLQPWLQDRRFSDADRGFKLHFLAGNILGQIGEEDSAIAHIQRAATYDPKDPDLQDARKSVAGLSRDILSSGTGFVVAEGGYILTNKHVVDGRGRVAVRIAGVKDPVPAKSVKLHAQLDVALVQIDMPESYKPQAVGLNTAKLNRGLEVAAFGYPQGDALGEDLKFTKGAISSLPNASLDNMILLDLRINPGNSGGPLCDVQGNVIGMITAKTGGVNLDSYGMAIPAEELDKFLEAVLPAGTKRGAMRPAKSGSTWAEVDSAISPAVLMIVKLR
jgi:S1-C subfamily serine protease